MTLYEIDQAIQGLVDPETGELMDYEAFAALQMDRDAKIENMALWYKDLMADAKAIKEEADTLNERRKALEKTARCSVTFRKTSSIQVSNPEALIRWLEQNGYDAECVKYKEPEVSKTGIGKLIKEGVPVPYASIEQGRSVGVK